MPSLQGSGGTKPLGVARLNLKKPEVGAKNFPAASAKTEVGGAADSSPAAAAGAGQGQTGGGGGNKPRVRKNIGGGWIEVESTTGDIYYANIETKQTSWDYPEGADPQAPTTNNEEKENADPAASLASTAGASLASTAGAGGQMTAEDLLMGSTADFGAEEIEEESQKMADLAALADMSMCNSMAFTPRDRQNAMPPPAPQQQQKAAPASSKPLPPSRLQQPSPSKLKPSHSASSSSLHQHQHQPHLKLLQSSASQLGPDQAGVGIILEQLLDKGPVIVGSLISGSPASISGTICPGDEVAHVDGVPVGGRTPSELRDVVVGPVGMPVTLGIIPARGVIDVKLVRGSNNNASSTSPDQSVVSSEEAAGWEAERRELGEELERQRGLRVEAEGNEAALLEERNKLSFEADALREAVKCAHEEAEVERKRQGEDIKGVQRELREAREEREACEMRLEESEARERQLIKSLEESTRQLSESETDKEMINQELLSVLEKMSEMKSGRDAESRDDADRNNQIEDIGRQLQEAVDALERESESRRCAEERAVEAEAAVEKLRITVEDASVRIDELGAKYEHARAEGTRLRVRIVESERAASEAGMKLGEAEITSRELSSKVARLEAEAAAAAAPSLSQQQTRNTATRPSIASANSPAVLPPTPKHDTGTNNVATPNTRGGIHSAREMSRTPQMGGGANAARGGRGGTPPIGGSTPKRGPSDLAGLVAVLREGADAAKLRDAVYSVALIALEAPGRAGLLTGSDDSVPVITKLLSSRDVGCKRYSALAIGNIAMEPRGRLRVLSSPNLMAELSSLLASNDTESVRYAALAIGNLVLESTGRKAALDDDACTRNLVSNLASDDRQTLRYATGALRNLAVEDKGRSCILSQEGSESLLKALTSSQDASTARYAAACLKNLALHPKR